MVRHGRALLVALHLFAVTAMAMPSVGGGMSRSAWKTPTVQAEFEAWSARLNGLGLRFEQGELEDVLWDLAVAWEAGREKVLAPFQPYYQYCGTWQSWRMFVAPHRYPGRLEVEVRTDGDWEPLYVGRSSEHDWHRRWLDHDRFRAAVFRYSWEHYRRPRGELADWFARLAASERPDARQLQVSFVRYRTRSPDEVKQGVPAKEKRELVTIRDLERLR